MAILIASGLSPDINRLLTRFKQAHQAAQLEPKGTKVQQEAKDTQAALRLFKADLGNHVRLYEFLDQMFNYGNTAYERLYLFAKMLLPLLDYGRERDGIDLSALRLSHHRMKDLGQQKLDLAGYTPATPLTPVTELGSGQVQDRQKERLAEIIEALNDLFVGDLTDGDKVSFFEGLRTKMLESEALKEQAAVNNEAQFANSPALHDEMMKAAMDGDAAHQSIVAQFLNSEALQAQVLALMLAKGELWRAFQAR